MNKFQPFISERLGPASAWRSPRHKRFWLLLAILFYTLVGFLVAPWVIQSQVIPRVAEEIGRPVILDELRINPFVLSVEARGFSLTEPDGVPLFGFDRLFINFQLSSLFRRAWTFREISLEGPFIEFMRHDSGETNLGRLMADIMTPGAAPAQSNEDSGLPRLMISELAILGGVIELTDFVPRPEVNSHMEPINITIRDLSTLPASTGQQDVLIKIGSHGRINWSGSLQLNPLLAAGRLEGGGRYLPIMYRYVEDLLAFEVLEGQAEFAFDYRIEVRDTGELAARVDNFDFDLRGIVMKTDDPVVEFLSLPDISLTSGRFRWPEQIVQLEGLNIDGARLHVINNPDGVLNLQRLLIAAEEAPLEELPIEELSIEELPVAEPEEVTMVHPLQDWTIELGELRIDDFGVLFEDQSLVSSVATAGATVNVVARDISNRVGAQFPFKLDINPDAGGVITLDGQLGVLPAPVLDSAMKIDRLALQIAQPWVADVARVEIDAGLFNADIRLQVNEQEPLALDGSLSIESMDISDVGKDERLVGWDRIAIDQLAVSIADNSLEVSEVGIHAPYVRILIDKDQTTNFEQLATGSESNGSVEIEETDPIKAPAVTVGRVMVTDGSADFTDLALPLPFSARIADLHGQISTLATASVEPATIELEGQVNQYGLASMAGRLLPANPADLTDIQLIFRNVDIPNFSPYTVKFAGRAIDDGSLDVTLKYLVESSALQGDNNIVMRELTLGDKIEHPEAANLPLGLAIALLKKPDGTIEINLPVSGNVDDPEFSVGGLVFKAFVNLITKAATSPFRLLGGLVGVDAEGLDEIEFRSGQSDLMPPELEKLTHLTEALTLRPGLGLILQGAVDPVADTDAMKVERVDAMIAERLEISAEEKADQSLLTRRLRRVLEALVHERLPDLDPEAVKAGSMRPKDPAKPEGQQVLDEPAYTAALKARLVEAEPVGQQDLDALAMARAGVIMDTVMIDERLTADRVMIGRARTTVTVTENGWIPMKLELDARDIARE